MSSSSSSSPAAVLPITNPTQDTTAGPIHTPALRLFFSHLTDTVKAGLAHRRPWPELVDRSAFSKPDSLSEAATRLKKNYSYFRTNYLSVLTLVLAVSLLTNPFSLISLLFILAAWVFFYLFRPTDPPLVLFGRSFSERETLAGLVLLTIVVVFLTSVGSVLISALLVGVAVISVHGAFRVPEDLFLDEPEGAPNAATGFLSFLGGNGSGPGRV